jgi:hypothetical protein
MKLQKVLRLFAGTLAASFLTVPMSANATIHEMVAAFCSGGGKGIITAAGFLEPPGVDGQAGNEQSFARPVIATGILDPFPLFADKPAAKFPEGASLFTLAVSQSDHPSALHCPLAKDLP